MDAELSLKAKGNALFEEMKSASQGVNTPRQEPENNQTLREKIKRQEQIKKGDTE